MAKVLSGEQERRRRFLELCLDIGNELDARTEGELAELARRNANSGGEGCGNVKVATALLEFGRNFLNEQQSACEIHRAVAWSVIGKRKKIGSLVKVRVRPPR